jgi:hypothetical protein
MVFKMYKKQKEMCLNQLIRPKRLINREGVGNCLTCITDKDNNKCKLYTPVNVTIFEIEEKED